MNVGQGTGMTLEAVVYPPCLCGDPYGEHRTSACNSYRPTRPVVSLGTRAFAPVPTWPWWRRLATAGIWGIEHRLQRVRERLARG